MDRPFVEVRDLGHMDYRTAWDYQENLLQQNVKVKQDIRSGSLEPGDHTRHYFLFVEHPPVYTNGKSGKSEHLLLNPAQLASRKISVFHTNRGGDITFHGPGQIVGYPILDLEQFGTDLGLYLRNLEEVIIRTLASYGIRGERSPGETGVWIDPAVPGRARKVAALGIRCSRWITMHGFALNVNTDLSYFEGIVACGITGKQVTSMEKELGRKTTLEEVRQKLVTNFEQVFQATAGVVEVVVRNPV